VKLSSRVAFAWKPSRANAARAAKRHGLMSPQINLVGLGSVFVVILFLLLVHRAFFGDLPRYAVNQIVAKFATPQPGALREDAISVTVTRDGHLFVRGHPILIQDLSTEIWQSLREGSERRVYLYTDPRASMQDVNQVIDGIHRAGIRDLVIMAQYPVAHM
jgi:biopolymer transport protein ExbD